MKNGSVLLLRSLLVLACLLAAVWPATAYIKAPPPPELGAMCQRSSHVSVLQVEKFSTEKGVILFKPAEQLKENEKLPEGALVKLVIRPDVKGAKVIVDWASEGKKAVLFALIRVRVGHLYIDGHWYRLSFDQENNCWYAVADEPHMLTGYCGSAEKFGEAVTKILRGEEVVVPAKLGEKSGHLIARELRAGHRIPGVEKKSKDRKPDLGGTVQALSDDGKSFTVLTAPTNKSKGPAPIDIRIADVTTITIDREPGQLAVGQTVGVWLRKSDAKIADAVHISKPKR
jgi:hypothetical protein